MNSNDTPTIPFIALGALIGAFFGCMGVGYVVCGLLGPAEQCGVVMVFTCPMGTVLGGAAGAFLSLWDSKSKRTILFGALGICIGGTLGCMGVGSLVCGSLHLGKEQCIDIIRTTCPAGAVLGGTAGALLSIWQRK